MGEVQSILSLDIVEDPESYALKKAIKSLGQVIYDLYGMNALETTGAGAASPGGFNARMSPVASALDGVGSGKDRWWS
jgi:hypothetical protein